MSRISLAVISAIVICLISPALAAPVAFTINAGSSSLALSGTVAGNSISQQTTGSLVTSYTGTINADLTATTIEILSTSLADASLQAQNQQPDDDGFGSPGSAPADYGFQVNSILGLARGAGRDVTLGLTSSPLAITGTLFPASLTIAANSGVVDYSVGVLGGRQDLSGDSGANGGASGSLQTVGSVQTLTLPISVTYTETILTTDDSQLTLTGTLVATRIVPEPTGMIAAIAGTCLLLTGRRRRALAAR